MDGYFCCYLIQSIWPLFVLYMYNCVLVYLQIKYFAAVLREFCARSAQTLIFTISDRSGSGSAWWVPIKVSIECCLAVRSTYLSDTFEPLALPSPPPRRTFICVPKELSDPQSCCQCPPCRACAAPKEVPLIHKIECIWMAKRRGRHIVNHRDIDDDMLLAMVLVGAGRLRQGGLCMICRLSSRQVRSFVAGGDFQRKQIGRRYRASCVWSCSGTHWLNRISVIAYVYLRRSRRQHWTHHYTSHQEIIKEHKRTTINHNMNKP